MNIVQNILKAKGEKINDDYKINPVIVSCVELADDKNTNHKTTVNIEGSSEEVVYAMLGIIDSLSKHYPGILFQIGEMLRQRLLQMMGSEGKDERID